MVADCGAHQSTEEFCSWGCWMEEESGGGEDEKPHVWNEDLHNNRNYHNHGNESAPHTHARTWCNRIKSLRIQLLRRWITVPCRDQWWRIRRELWHTRLSNSLDSCSLCVCLVLTGDRHAVSMCHISCSHWKKKFHVFLMWILATLINMKLRNDIIVLFRPPLFSSRRKMWVKFSRQGVIVFQNSTKLKGKKTLKVKTGWEATKSMCYLCWDNRQHKERRAESKFCLPFSFFWSEKILPLLISPKNSFSRGWDKWNGLTTWQQFLSLPPLRVWPLIESLSSQMGCCWLSVTGQNKWIWFSASIDETNKNNNNNNYHLTCYLQIFQSWQW